MWGLATITTVDSALGWSNNLKCKNRKQDRLTKEGLQELLDFLLLLLNTQLSLSQDIQMAPLTVFNLSASNCQNPNSTNNSIEQSLRLDYILYSHTQTELGGTIKWMSIRPLDIFSRNLIRKEFKIKLSGEKTTPNDSSGVCPNVTVTSIANMYYVFAAKL